MSKIHIRDGAACVRGVNQYCVQKVIDGTLCFYNETVPGYWAAFCTVLTKQEAKKVLKFMRSYDRSQKVVARRKVNINVAFNSDFNLWEVDASDGRIGTSLSYVRKPSPKQLRKLRKAVATSVFSTRVSYSIKHGKFI